MGGHRAVRESLDNCEEVWRLCFLLWRPNEGKGITYHGDRAALCALRSGVIMGDCYFKLGRFAKAIELSEQALESVKKRKSRPTRVVVIALSGDRWLTFVLAG